MEKEHKESIGPTEDCISRQAAIDAIDFYNGANEQHFTVENLFDDIKQLPSVQPKHGEWIPTSERLPEEYGEYLVTWTTSDSKKSFLAIMECEVTNSYDYEKNRFEVEWLPDEYIKNYHDVKIIAWMPLSEPYKQI